MDDLSPAESRIALTAYAAATDASRWPPVLAAIAALVEASVASLGTVGDPGDPQYLRHDHNVDRLTLLEYATHWAARDVWVTAASMQGRYRSGNVCIGSDVLPWEELQSTEFYNEFAAPAGLKAMASSILYGQDEPDQPMTHLSVFRAPGRAEFQRRDAAALARLSPHLKRAVRCARALRQVREAVSGALALLDALPQPTLVLRGDGLIEHANAAAMRWLRTTGARVRHGRLYALGADARPLSPALARVMAGATAVIAFTRDSTGMALLRLAPVAGNAPFLAAWPRAAVVGVFEDRSIEDELALLAAVAQRHGLTATEASVLSNLGKGQDPKKIAATMRISIITVRSHLARLYEKTGTRRQAQLVGLLRG